MTALPKASGIEERSSFVLKNTQLWQIPLVRASRKKHSVYRPFLAKTQKKFLLGVVLNMNLRYLI